MIWKLIQFPAQLNLSEWDELIQKHLGQKPNDKRLKSFVASRMALKICLEAKGHQLRNQDLNLFGHHALDQFSQYTLSLSHTHNFGAALLAPRSQFRSVGIDIELKSRTVGQAILDKVSHPKDFTFKPIELWCLKEACYKALMNTDEFTHAQNFSDISILKDSWFHSPSGIRGQWELDSINEIQMSRAWINIPS